MLITQYLGLQHYKPIWDKMLEFTVQRNSDTPDELWFLEHYPVYTQGQAGKPEHILNPGNIEVVQSDRGGQVTYHGPGQLIAYVLLDINRRQLGIRSLVSLLEQCLINTLAKFDIHANTTRGAPGVYVANKKIASIGLRVKQGCSYHGLALNVDMDLGPFLGINPCGYQSLEMTQIKEWVPMVEMIQVQRYLQSELEDVLC